MEPQSKAKLSKDSVAGMVVGIALMGLLGYLGWELLGGSGPENKAPVATGNAPAAEVADPPVTGPRSRPAAGEDPAWAGRPKASASWAAAPHGGIAEEPLTVAQALCPLVESVTINHVPPHASDRKELVGRSWEMQGLMRFDLTGITRAPTKAVLKAGVYGMENTRGYQTPARLVFYRMVAKWDDTASHHFANTRDGLVWPSGSFDLKSEQDLDVKPVATVEVPNPVPGGFNVEVDVTEVVAGWTMGKYANCGLLVTTQQLPGYTYQANLCTRIHTPELMPRIICTMEGEK